MLRKLALVMFAGCAGGDDSVLLSQLDGSWDGTVFVAPDEYVASALFIWDDTQQLVSGTVDVAEIEGPHSYAVRRWSVTNDIVGLELTDVTDGTRGLHLSGTVGATFDGDATVRYPCDVGTCGYVGVISLTKGATTLGTPPTDTGTP
jgi:hypothetical protein